MITIKINDIVKIEEKINNKIYFALTKRLLFIYHCLRLESPNEGFKVSKRSGYENIMAEMLSYGSLSISGPPGANYCDNRNGGICLQK